MQEIVCLIFVICYNNNMKNTKETRTLRFVDIDETVFHTTAKVIIRTKSGAPLKALNNKEWNAYPKDKIIAKQEFADFCEFTSSEKFFSESTPVLPMIALLKKWSYDMKTHRENSKDMVVFVTARGDFDDREKFLNAFRKEQIAIDDPKHFYISRTGNLTADVRMNGIHLSTAQRKKVEYLHFLMAKMPSVAELYEDDAKNVHDFLELKTEMPDIEFRAYLVKNDKIEQVE